MTARNLVVLLESRHCGDVFVPECKMGAAGSRTLDGWALLPTWSPLTTIGYEVKVSRSDWTRDQKFEEYRACCHLFFIVAPKGIVDRAELPAGVGLLEPIGEGTGQRLVLRVKPVRQEPDSDQLVRLMAHVLMWRKGINVDASLSDERRRRAERWRGLLAEQKEFRRLGREVKGRIRQEIAAAWQKQDAAEQKAIRLEAADQVLCELGITSIYDVWSARRELTKAINGEQDRLLESIRTAVAALKRIETAIQTPTERIA
jgi:hypothetical protein